MALSCVFLAVVMAAFLLRIKPTTVTLFAMMIAIVAVMQLHSSLSDESPRPGGARPASISLTWDGSR